MTASGQRKGIANLPLHYGKAAPCLSERMRQLAREITIVTVMEFGADEMLRRLPDPFWFQAFGCVLGSDWHCSGRHRGCLPHWKAACTGQSELPSSLLMLRLGSSPELSQGKPSQRSDSNRRPTVYETAALPLSYAGAGTKF